MECLAASTLDYRKYKAMFEVQEVNSLDVAFGCRAMELMPKYDDIPEEYKHGNTKWNKLFNDWFFSGLSNLDITPKPGVDRNKAISHIRAVMGSFEPPHEHKEAGVAFLMAEWFEDAKWDRNKRKD